MEKLACFVIIEHIHLISTQVIFIKHIYLISAQVFLILYLNKQNMNIVIQNFD